MSKIIRVRKILKEITEGKGRFSRDNLTHAENTIEDMKQLAREGLEVLGSESSFTHEKRSTQ